MYDFFDPSNWFFRLAIIFFFLHGVGSIFYFVKRENRPKNVLWWAHQILWNGTGAFIGWAALYYFFESDLSKIGIQHFVALIIGFLGVTGYLPFAVMSLLKTEIIKRIRVIGNN
jgi:hypothetical protein